MNRLLIAVTLLAFASPVVIASSCGFAEQIPSYQESLAAFQAEQAKAAGPMFTADERQIMERAAQDLAAELPDPGLGIGDKAPDVTLPNAFGKQVRLTDLLAEQPVVLTFYRGAWCPYCNLQLRGLQKTLPYIEREGAQLVAVTPQKPDKSREQVEQDGYPFEMLSDLDDAVMKAYRLYFEVLPGLSAVYKQRLSLDLAEYNGEGKYVLPVPATFVIDRSGVIRAAFADVDYRKRVEPAAILAALRAINTR